MFNRKKLPKPPLPPGSLPASTEMGGIEIPGAPKPMPKPPAPPRAPEPEPQMPEVEKATKPPEPPAASAMNPPSKSGLPKKSAPLFIKIELYRDVIKSIQELKSYALGLRDALDALGDVEKELRNGLDITQRALDRFNNAIATLDSKLLKLDSGERMPEVPEEMDEYIKKIYDQVEKIRHELRTIDAED